MVSVVLYRVQNPTEGSFLRGEGLVGFPHVVKQPRKGVFNFLDDLGFCK